MRAATRCGTLRREGPRASGRARLGAEEAVVGVLLVVVGRRGDRIVLADDVDADAVHDAHDRVEVGRGEPAVLVEQHRLDRHAQ